MMHLSVTDVGGGGGDGGGVVVVDNLKLDVVDDRDAPVVVLVVLETLVGAAECAD